MNLEEIMKPYYKKQDEIKERNKQIDEIAEKQISNVNFLVS